MKLDILFYFVCYTVPVHLAQYPNPTRIVGGETSGFYKWPFMAALLRRKDQRHFCGGSVWNSDYIVTAAHCLCHRKTERLMKPDNFQVYLGNANLTTLDEDYVFDVKRIILHRYFHWQSIKFDIAILKLSRPIDFGYKNLKVTCVCGPEPLENLERTKCVTLGWGSTVPVDNDMSPQPSPFLQEVELPLLDDSRCADTSQKFNSHWNLCAGHLYGGKPRDSCKGDSGGPLVCPVRGIVPPVWSLVGITSFGSDDCGKSYSPGYYTRVIRLQHWIEKNTGES